MANPGRMAGAPDLSEMKVWITPPGKAKMLAEGKKNKKRVVVMGYVVGTC